MLFKETIDKSKVLAQKTIQNLKSFLFGGYQKLPKSFSFNSFSCGSSKLKNCKTDQIYTGFYEEWEPRLDEIDKRGNKVSLASEELMKEEESACGENYLKLEEQNPVKNKKQGLKEKKKIGSSRVGKAKELNSQNTNVTGHVLAQKMRELEMIDAGDMEQALDIEEAIHYYSRLKSPVYLDIVDKFFVDMYSELSIPQASVKISNSKRRRGSFRL